MLEENCRAVVLQADWHKMKGRVEILPLLDLDFLLITKWEQLLLQVWVGHKKTVGSFNSRLMRNGSSPQEACEEAIRRIITKHERKPDSQVGFVAINIAGEKGAYSINRLYTYYESGKAINVSAASVY